MNAAIEIADRYRARADAFERKVVGVQPHRWSDQSPCERWDARGVVQHVIDMHGAMLRVLDRSLNPAPSVADDPVGAFRSARADIEAVLADPELAGTECATPEGSMTAAEHIDKVASEDLPLHGWDLARATGQDDTIDPKEVARIWTSLQAMPSEQLEKYRTPGAFGPDIEVFGPQVEVPEDAPLQDRLLGMIGRDPDWRPAGGASRSEGRSSSGQPASDGPSLDVVASRIFDAPVVDVWRAWSDPDYVKQWWGPDGFTGGVDEMDFREGGSALVSMSSPELGEHRSRWSYQRIVPLQSIEFVLTFADQDGNRVEPGQLGLPDGIPDGVPHMITFKDLGEGRTEMIVTERGYTSERTVELSRHGLEQSLDKMARTLSLPDASL